MNHVLVITALLLIALFANPALAAEPACPLRLPAIFGDNMVLQSGMPVKVWGWAAPGQKVTVKIAGQEKTASADEQGRWLVKLDALQAGGLLEMTVAAGEQTLAFKNVLAGEVWVCSGQSNMGTGVGMTTYGLKEISEAKFPKIRIFAVPMNASPTGPAEEIGAAWGCFHARWMECTPETIGAFPAVGYFFAKKVHKETGLPMGMIESVWGGTGQEAWLSRQGFESDPDFKPLLQQADDWLAKKYPDAKAKYEAALAQYEKAKPEEVLADDTGWETVSLDERDWKEVKLPGTVSMNGVAWFRRAVTIPSEWSGKDLKISLGNIPDEDVTYVNGTKVGGVNDWDAPREYDVSAELVKSGRAVIALRVTGYGGGTGPAGTPEQMLLWPVGVAGVKPISLAGAWKHRPAIKRRVLPVAMDYGSPPGSVYNGMIAPLTNFAIRGVLWYQGEGGGFHYDKLFPAMIRDWRKQWGQGDFPFLYVQLPNLTSNNNVAVEEGWVNVRETQLKTLALPNTGMAVTIDVGDPTNVHYRNKQPVGERLALWRWPKCTARTSSTPARSTIR